MSLLAVSGYQLIHSSTISDKNNETRLSCPLRPHSTTVSATHQPLVTAILFAGPLLPGKLDICDIPVEKMRELTIDLSGEFDQKSLQS